LRYVGHPDRRIAEARKFGLTPVLGPHSAEEKGAKGPSGLRACDSLAAAIAAARSVAAAEKPLSEAA
jgi:hypothetical protein